MTLQQLEYIVAVDKYRQFVKAAEACGVTQPTLSSMIQKLEAELNLQIFDRNSHPIGVTAAGETVISQAKVILYHVAQLEEMVLDERQMETGSVSMGVIPTIAPYILPGLFKEIHEHHPGIALRVIEARTSVLIEKLEKAEIDMALLSTPMKHDELLEIPVYYEKFHAYFPAGSPFLKEERVRIGELPLDELWVLQEGHCLRNQVLSFCGHQSKKASVYEAGSIETLVRIVDENGGYTVIPELHIELLTEEQRARTRSIVDPEPVREVSLVVRADYVRERLLNIMAASIRSIVPESMVDSRLKKFAIKL
ncbi:MAG: LysR family transcriptional regulator [Bacteroidales bacterium]|nr:LysR family transcriptional regulator [Bacteroidales bacterium]